ncbi:MAG: MFS transporter [Clostridia bacterium]|nr:MFS transporter [Clostridia bacterium]
MRVKSLDKKWKELLFSFSGFGPNFLMVLMGAFFTDAINPAAIGNEFQAIMKGTCFILPAVFPILNAIGKVFDGVIDIPFAYVTDSLSTKWGRRRPTILICFLPMVISFALCWFPVAGHAGSSAQLINTIWIFAWSIVFFATYTMCLITFYGSLSTTCCDEAQRTRVSGLKSFFDTISYCIVYALVPVILEGLHIHIDTFVFCALPIMLTMLIPLFLIKEGAKYGYPENDGLRPEKISIWQSLKLTFGNKPYLRWICVNSCTFFGMQMFLVSMNALVTGGMGMNGFDMAILNTCAFAPVPICLYLFQKLKARKGIRFAYQTCLLAFAIGILNFFFGSTFITGGNRTIQYIIGCAGGVLASWSIGSFFMMPYLVPAQISSVEEKLTGKNHSAMYFAADAVATSVVGAISGSLVYELIKNYFFCTGAPTVEGVGKVIQAVDYDAAAAAFGVAKTQVVNISTIIVPFLVCLVCLVGFGLAFLMPKDYTPRLVARELKKFDPSLDITEFEKMEMPKPEKGEILYIQIALSVLSGFIFGFIWAGYLFRSFKELWKHKKPGLGWALSCFIPFVGIYYLIKAMNEMKSVAGSTKLTGSKALYIVFGLLFPLLPLNVVALSVMQHDVNKVYATQHAAEEISKVEDAVVAND